MGQQFKSWWLGVKLGTNLPDPAFGSWLPLARVLEPQPNFWLLNYPMPLSWAGRGVQREAGRSWQNTLALPKTGDCWLWEEAGSSG